MIKGQKLSFGRNKNRAKLGGSCHLKMHWNRQVVPRCSVILLWSLSSLLFNLFWSIIASQYCVSFCCTTKRISHMHTHVLICAPSWASLPSSLPHPSRSSRSTEPISLCYAAASHQPTILCSVVYICQRFSHFAPASRSHPMSWSPFSMPASLFLPYT